MVGTNILIDLYDCSSGILNDVFFLEKIMIELIEMLGCRLLSTSFYEFSPYGVSGNCILAESHASIHTWVEEKVVCLDFFSCKDIEYNKKTLSNFLDYLKYIFRAESISFKTIKRGRELKTIIKSNAVCQITKAVNKSFKEK